MAKKHFKSAPKIIAHTVDGKTIKGYTGNFDRNDTYFHIVPAGEGPADRTVRIPLKDLKAIFFVRDFEGGETVPPLRGRNGAVIGKAIEVEFADGEVVIGKTLTYQGDEKGQGFFIIPLNPRDNNERIFVINSSVKQITEIPGYKHEVELEVSEKTPQRKKLLYTFFLLIPLGIVFYLSLQKQDIKPLEVSPQAARSLETKLARLERASLAKKPIRVEITQEELHSLIAEQLGEIKADEEYAKKNIKLDDIQMRFEGDKLKRVVTMKIKGKPVYLSLSGGVSVVEGILTLNPDEAKIGKLPVSVKTVQRVLKRAEKEKGNLAFLALPTGVRDVRVEEGKLILEAGPEETIKEISIRKEREANEANSWLQVGDNFASLEMYSLALEYYRKVVDKYPESEQAQEARKRIKETEAKSEPK